MTVEDSYNDSENNFSPLTVALLTLLIGGLVWLGASFCDNLTNYGSQPKPDPVNLMASGSNEENFYSPGRAKRRANFFLRRQGEGEQISSEEKALLEEEDRTKERDREDREESRQEQGSDSSEGDIVKALQPPAPSVSGWGENGSGATGVSPVAPHELKLSGIMLGSGAGIAVIDYNGVSYTKSEGQSVGRYTVAKILSDRVIVEDGVNTFTLGLNSSGASDLASTSQGGFKNGHPVLPDPGQVPPPQEPSVTAKTAFRSEPAPSVASLSSIDEEAEEIAAAGSSSSVPVPSKIDVYNLAQERRAEEEKKAENLYSSKNSTKANVKLPKANPTSLRPTREEIEKYLQRGAAIISEIKVQPDPGGLGVKVKFIQEDNVLNRLGIKDGDVITRVNNKAILNSEELFNSVLSISEMPFVNIEYKRQGHTDTLVYDL